MPASKINTLVVFVAVFSQAFAHTYVKKLKTQDKEYDGFYAADITGGSSDSPAWWTNQGWGFRPVMGDKINHPDIIAHMDAQPAPFTAPVDAGSDVTFTWQHDGECGGDEVGWDCSHHGWRSAWLADCGGNCANVEKQNLKFFKIEEAGLIDYRQGRYSDGGAQANTGYWGTDAIFYDGNNQHTVTIPKDLPSGNYVLRAEVASIHNNGPVSKRQFWPQAFNIAIRNGNDNAKVPDGVKATEIYNESDELLQWNLYWHDAGKTIPDAPGPALASCAAGGNDDGKPSATESALPGYSTAPISATPSVAIPYSPTSAPQAATSTAEAAVNSAAPAPSAAPEEYVKDDDGYAPNDKDEYDDGEDYEVSDDTWSHKHWRSHPRDFANWD